MSNDCSAGLIYKKVLETTYKNPLVFKKIYFDDFIKLIKNYDIINFSNYELKKDNDWHFRIEVDNIFTAELNHYRFDKTVDGIKKNFPDVYSNKIWEYIVEKYETRLLRMNERPIFIGHYDYGQLGKWDPTLSVKKLNDFCSFLKKSNLPCLIISELPIEETESDTFKIIRFSRKNGDEFIKNKKEIIEKLNFLNEKF